MSKLIVECTSHLEGTDLHIETVMKVEPNLTDISPQIFKKIIHLEESKIREALIKLGWQPPAGRE